MTESNKIRNALTEHNCNYKLINPNLMLAYVALSPPSLSKISIALFMTIIANKRYYKENSEKYSEAEEKRIYNSTVITPEHIMMQCSPSKYAVDAKDMQKDFSNLVKRLNELDDMNLFYMWRTGFPHVYMFFIERDIGVWKYFNSKGVVTPKTILKIIKWDNKIVDCMISMLIKEKQNLSKKEVENSFGLFINRMIGKMNPEVGNKLSKWKGVGELCNYCNMLASELRKLDPFEGLEQDETFISNLPIDIKMKLMPKTKENTKENTMGFFDADVEEAIMPKEKKQSVIKQTRKNTLLRVSEVEGVKPKLSTYTDEFDPLKNCNTLITFYRGSVRQSVSLVKFADPDTDRKYATEILDMLIQAKRNNLRFLKGWIEYFISKHLSTEMGNGAEKTSMNVFKKTFSEFNERYVEPV